MMTREKSRIPCVCGSLRRGARLTTQIYDRFLQPAGIKVTQYSMLSAIQRSGDISIKDLAAETLLERTTCTRNLRILERKSLIHLQQGKDKRVKTVRLSSGGIECLKLATPLWEEAQQFIMSEAGEEETALLLKRIKGFVDTLRDI